MEVLQSRLNYYEKELQEAYRTRYSLEGVVGESAPMREAKQIARQAAASDLPVLIVGETGTGKEVFAHAIHLLSFRGERPLVRVNCAAIPNGASSNPSYSAMRPVRSRGQIPRANRASSSSPTKVHIFLDEMGDLPMPMQAKLLRVIQSMRGGAGRWH